MARTVFLETSFIIALENRSDNHHERAKSLDRELFKERATFLLHSGIILEIGDGYARRHRRNKGQWLIERLRTELAYSIEPITDSLFDDGFDLYRTRADKDWQLTDCISFVLMEQSDVTEALTADQHFVQAGFHALLLAG